eukprot:96973-Hanusia_phi.AAC.1
MASLDSDVTTPVFPTRYGQTETDGGSTARPATRREFTARKTATVCRDSYGAAIGFTLLSSHRTKGGQRGGLDRR